MTFEEALSTSSVNGGDRTVREALEVLQDRLEKIYDLLKRWHEEGPAVNDPGSPSILLSCCLELENELYDD